MHRRTLVAALAALLVPMVTAENPTITVPKVDPSGPSASAQAIQEDSQAFADGAAALVASTPGVVFAHCPVPTPPDPPACDALAIPTDEEAQLNALLGRQGAALVDDVGALVGEPIVALSVVGVKLDEAGAVVQALAEVTGPSATAALLVVGNSVQANTCPVSALPTTSCGEDSVLTAYLSGAEGVYASARGLVVKVDAGATCPGAKALVASLSPAAGQAIDCAALPNGGMVVALLPSTLG